jgi:hypothetical protein
MLQAKAWPSGRSTPRAATNVIFGKGPENAVKCVMRPPEASTTALAFLATRTMRTTQLPKASTIAARMAAKPRRNLRRVGGDFGTGADQPERADVTEPFCALDGST